MKYQEGDWMVVDHNRFHGYIKYLVTYDLAEYFAKVLDASFLMEGLSLEDKAMESWSYLPIFAPTALWDCYMTPDLEELPSKDEPVYLTIYYEDVDVLIERGDVFTVED